MFGLTIFNTFIVSVKITSKVLVLENTEWFIVDNLYYLQEEQV